ncbi:6740_t:CDS:2 [Entrophospora sp. SA101]|nr:6740_t:CDS:2 [Entrophospora sp. SA101]
MPKFNPTEKDKEIINKANIRGEIKNIDYFLHDKNYVIIINRIARLYAIRLIKYEDDDKNRLKILAVKRFPNLVEFYLTKEEVENKVESIKANNDGEIDQFEWLRRQGDDALSS